MAARQVSWLICAAGLAAAASPPSPAPSESRGDVVEVLAGAPSSLSVTVYRDPYRASGSMELDRLNGFALITETRAVHLQAGDNHVSFAGVADGIEPESVIVTGFDDATLEKNRDAAVLSPSALVAAAVGKPLMLTRTNPRSGRVEHVPGTVLSDAEGGVIFESEQGIEALRCSGLPEMLSFEGPGGLKAHPTLSVRVRARREASATVTLSYLAHGFDWGADYSATLSADGRSMELGAWVTLANGNGTGFPEARTQVVAGRVNRESGEVEPLDIGGPIIASCWPRGSTSDVPMQLQVDLRQGGLGGRAVLKSAIAAAPMTASVAVTAQRVQQEQLGDLKLYRIPEPTTVAARQSKQVRLLDRSAIPVATVYAVDLPADDAGRAVAASRHLRTMNTEADHLGLPLPSGRVQVFGMHQGRRLLERETGWRDLALNEQVEIDLGPSSAVRAEATGSGRSHRVEIANAEATAIAVEVSLSLEDGIRVVDARPAAGTKNGRPLFALTIPARSTGVVTYRTSASP